MNRIFVGAMLAASIFIGACGSSSSDATSDPCAEDLNLPECQQDNDQDDEQNTEPEEQEPAVLEQKNKVDSVTLC